MCPPLVTRGLIGGSIVRDWVATRVFVVALSARVKGEKPYRNGSEIVAWGVFPPEAYCQEIAYHVGHYKYDPPPWFQHDAGGHKHPRMTEKSCVWELVEGSLRAGAVKFEILTSRIA